MTILAAIGDIRRFENPRKLVGYAGLGAGVDDSGHKPRGKGALAPHASAGVTKSGRKELRWAVIEAAWQAIRSNPQLRAKYDRLCKRKPAHQAIVAIARKLLVSVWYVLSEKEPYNRSSEEDLAYKMLTWAWHVDKMALAGMTPQQFAKYGLMRLGVGVQLTCIVRGGSPRRIAPMEEVLALRPDLEPPQ